MVANTSQRCHFQPHSRPINCLSFSPYDPNKLVSTSYDGSVRCFDLDEQVPVVQSIFISFYC